MKKVLILFVPLILLGMKTYAQQDPVFTYYMNNTLALNPAYAGSREALTLTALHRSQWVGFDGAPVTQTFTMHAPVLNQHIGLGLSVLNDKIGPVNNTSASIDYAFILKSGEKSKLSFGLKGSAYFLSTDLASLYTNQTGDVAFENGRVSRTLPNVGFGMYYSRNKFYAGISAPKLIENKVRLNNVSLHKFARHYYLIAGKVFALSRWVDLKVTTLVKATPGAPIQGDLTAQITFSNAFMIGAGYRSGDAASLQAGVFFTPQLLLAYAYDYSFGNQTLLYNSGSHEIMLRYDFIYKNHKKVRSPRYF